ncbi:23S rRNA (adenine(2030)-N(6))-methyltransferase RlmJ [Enterovirga rhinocerotis]|uniref:Ribosomal RNA large subunit methyltransferase J n=1 Tax=Enterovirga rhinocerotis TaxID=1339210 RepID=A0A4R7BV51_9HYPH|nr:23S rRNA (adenine(2030)-N(6))-methyltransferase RlmJ [Enterovirga rhinocerotis]TDR88077.1 23S rRNA (adenine2030-N6)-methyltransferase [Enterovirga rhinocerotis]
MNYRHAFHAGNFADVMKHVLLVRMLVHLQKKPAAFRTIDTHAGIGLYDLDGDEAARTGEWIEGVGRMEEPFAPDVEALLAPWRSLLQAVRARHGTSAYAGSPAIVRELLRPQDQAVLVEKHPADADSLRARYNDVRNIKVLHLDGWTALGSLIPPKERRGLVLIDPPFEEPGELARAAERLAKASRRWPTGLFALWYPIKVERDVDAVARTLSQILTRPAVRLELLVDRADGTRLAGSGLVVVNPPWTLPAEASLILPALAARLGRSADAKTRVDVLVEEEGKLTP